MTVWILEYGFIYENSCIWGVYASEKLALQSLKNKIFEDYGYAEITEYCVTEEGDLCLISH